MMKKLILAVLAIALTSAPAMAERTITWTDFTPRSICITYEMIDHDGDPETDMVPNGYIRVCHIEHSADRGDEAVSKTWSVRANDPKGYDQFPAAFRNPSNWTNPNVIDFFLDLWEWWGKNSGLNVTKDVGIE